MSEGDGRLGIASSIGLSYLGAAALFYVDPSFSILRRLRAPGPSPGRPSPAAPARHGVGGAPPTDRRVPFRTARARRRGRPRVAPFRGAPSLQGTPLNESISCMIETNKFFLLYGSWWCLGTASRASLRFVKLKAFKVRRILKINFRMIVRSNVSISSFLCLS